MKFIVDQNVGKLVKWLRMLGYDTIFFTGDDDWQMIMIALGDARVILTRDTGVVSRGVVTSGRLRAVLIASEKPEEQIRQVVEAFDLDISSGLFTLCLECNVPLEPKTKEQVSGQVPPYVYSTQEQYVGCPNCHRIYWKGTHWRAMTRKLSGLRGQ